MKKILIGFALGASMLSFAQQYPDYGGGNDGYYQNDGGYYSDQDDQNYFPDDYYYNYPQDYYPTDYYRNNYNDYRNSVVSINWNVFFNQNRLAPWQVDQIIRLNNLYSSFSAWNNFYRYNPDRWYYDRFYALERIMGPRVFVVFQNNYYRGYSPVTYFQDYRRVHYAGICRPVPRYRNVNINIYRVDRHNFRRTDNPTFNIVRSQRPDNGFRDSGYGNNINGFRGRPDGRNNNTSGLRTDNGGVRGNGGFRGNNNAAGSDSGGFRAENNANGGFRNNNGGFRGNAGVRREEAPSRENNGGFRNNNEGFRGNTGIRREEAPRRENNGGFRNEGGFRRSENPAPREQNRGGNEGRGTGGFRTGLVKN